MTARSDFIVVGAGVSGLVAALLVARRGHRVRVVERSNSAGGLAGAETFRGLPCDLGSHRLHPDALSSPMLLEAHQARAFATRRRRGVLLLGDRRVSYPPNVVDILGALGPRVALSFAGRLLARRKDEPSPHRWDRDRLLRPGTHDAGFEQFVVERVGRAAYRAFYAPYAEKVWGVPPSELSQSVAKRRASTTSPLGLFRDAAGALAAIGTGKPREKTDTFLYPPGGISSISDYLQECLAQLSVPIELGSPFRFDERGPLVLHAGRLADIVPTTLEHRGVYLVYIALPIERASEAETHYSPDPRHYFGRVSELSNYSPALRRPGETILCAEIPEGRWGRQVDFATGERFAELLGQLERAGIVPPHVTPLEVRQRFVPDVYPLYRRAWLGEWDEAMRRIVALGNVFPFGRQALFLHCNIDHCVDIASALVSHIEAGGDPSGWVERARGYLELRVRD